MSHGHNSAAAPLGMIANLELLPLRLNESKNDKIGSRQRSLAMKLYDAGLLSAEGLKKVQRAKR